MPLKYVLPVVGAMGLLFAIGIYRLAGRDEPDPKTPAGSAAVDPVPQPATKPSPVAKSDPTPSAKVDAKVDPAGTAPVVAPVASTSSDPFAREMLPFLSKHCFHCHSAKSKKGGLNLERFDTLASVVKDRKLWERAITNLRGGDMPPAGRPRPTRKENDDAIAFLETHLSQVDCNKPDPGRPTLRRLNRAEYNNTVRDLVGIDFQPAEDFPADDVGYGFDNIGDVLSMPPLLVEKYLAAAEAIVDKVVAAQDPANRPIKRFNPEDLKLEGTAAKVGTRGAALAGAGEIFADYAAPADGEYTVRTRAFSRLIDNDPAKMSLRVDGKEVKTFDVKTDENRPVNLETKLKLSKGSHRIGVALLNPKRDPKAKDPRRNARAVGVMSFEVESAAGSAVAAHHRIFIDRKSGQSRREWTKEIIARFARRAFRRPATDAELNRLLQFVDVAEAQGDPMDKGIRLALSAVLVSPHFLFRIEADRQAEGPDRVRTVNEFELASRLSYFLWSTMPDEELLGLAEQGKLRANLDAQITRMLADAKARELTRNFAGQWLQIRNLRTFAPDRRQFPDFNDGLRNDMIRETEMFFETVMREDRSVLDFLDSDWTMLNERLAKHYGINGVTGPQFRKVALTDSRRGGVLTQGSILAITSNPTRTSPVKRGKWVLEQILGTPPPAPPADVPDLEDDKRQLTGSLRQRMEQHRANPNCAVCHTKMDAMGFAFENYDPIGKWRDTDGPHKINPAGTLPDGRSFQGPPELKGILKQNKDLFARNLAEKMLTFALGRGLEFYDRCAVDKISKQLVADGMKFSSLVRGVVLSEPFQKRRLGTKSKDEG